MADIRIIVLHPDERYCNEIAKPFREYDPDMGIEAVVDLRSAADRVAEDAPGMVAVAVDAPNDPALRAIEAISAVNADVGIIVISKEPTQELLVSCMRAGADEFLEYPVDPGELAKAMEGLARRKGIISTRQGKVVAVFSPAGGVGVTTVASGLAAGIATELSGRNVCCILDMCLQFGSVALAMDIREFSHTLADAAHDSDRLDENLLRSMMSVHSSGCAVLPAPLSVAELETLDPWHVRAVIQTCRKMYQYVVLDTPHHVDEVSIVGFDEADEIFVVCDMVLPSIRNTIRALEMFRELEYKNDKLKLVLNRYYDSHQVSLDEIVKHVGLPIHWLVPYDSRAAITAMNSGQTIDAVDPESQAGHSLVALAQDTAGIVPKARQKRKRGFFSWSR